MKMETNVSLTPKVHLDFGLIFLFLAGPSRGDQSLVSPPATPAPPPTTTEGRKFLNAFSLCFPWYVVVVFPAASFPFAYISSTQERFTFCHQHLHPKLQSYWFESPPKTGPDTIGPLMKAQKAT